MSKEFSVDRIATKIHVIRNIEVMLDHDLAHLYGIPTKILKRAVNRNMNRFPDDFMLRLRSDETEILRYQIGTSSWGGRRDIPYVFSEQGVAMLSSVLRSTRAVMVNISIMRAFTKLRKILTSHKELAKKIDELEIKIRKQDGRSKRQSQQIRLAFTAIRELMENKKRIGF